MVERGFHKAKVAGSNPAGDTGIKMTINLDILDWTAVSAIILAITVIYIAYQTKATKKLAEIASSPTVDLMMIYHKDEKNSTEGTRFQFLSTKQNFSDLWIKTITNCGEQCTDEHFNGEEPFHLNARTYATNYIDFFKKLLEKNSNKVVEVWFEIFLSPVFDKKPKTFSYKKHYQFDRDKRQWIDIDWGISDNEIRVTLM